MTTASDLPAAAHTAAGDVAGLAGVAAQERALLGALRGVAVEHGAEGPGRAGDVDRQRQPAGREDLQAQAQLGLEERPAGLVVLAGAVAAVGAGIAEDG